LQKVSFFIIRMQKLNKRERIKRHEIKLSRNLLTHANRAKVLLELAKHSEILRILETQKVQLCCNGEQMALPQRTTQCWKVMGRR